MPPPIPDETRHAILHDIHAGELSRNAIARKHDVSTTTVSKIAKDNAIERPFSRENTEKATRARTADLAAERADLKADLLGDARRLRDRAWSEYTYYERSAEGPERVTLDLPPLAEVRQAYTALGIALDKHAMLDKHDADHGASDTKSMLGSLAAGLQAAYDQLPDDSATDES